MGKYILIILCILLASIGMAYSAEAIDVRFTSPPNGAIVSKTVELELVAKDIPTGYDFWIGVYPVDVKRYYIQDKRHFPPVVSVRGTQSIEALVGSNEDTGLKFDIFAIVADRDAIRAIMDYLDNSNAEGSWPGLEKLPSGAKIYHTITVTRK